jgi:hypothetical protein
MADLLHLSRLRCACFALAAMAAACLGSGTQTAHVASHAQPARWAVHLDRRDALAISTPRGWAFTLRPVPRLLEPSVPLAVGSAAVPKGGGCAPARAIRALPRGGVLLWVYEYHSHVRARDFPVRRAVAPIRLGPLGGPYECLGVRAYTILFRIERRFFQAHVVARTPGRHVLAQAERVLSSLAVRPA